MSNQPSMAVVNGTVTFNDGHGNTFTAHGVEVDEGSAVSAEIAQDGVWFVVERDGERQRYPLRRDGEPHFTEMQAMQIPSNPFFIDPTAGVEIVRERSEPPLKSRGRSSTADIRESALDATEGGSEA
ncbi:hypothetical protein [Nocardia sp. NPDC059228]|uniref:hypothetical protein n=1 Tax=Nocardia sp. NPDC059228 TaxID=3346777 RepID=UPI003693A6D4